MSIGTHPQDDAAVDDDQVLDGAADEGGTDDGADDPEMTAAKLAYQRDLEQLGAQFSDDGELVGWKTEDAPKPTEQPAPIPKSDDDDEKPDAELQQMVRNLQTQIANSDAQAVPVRVKVLLDAACETDPSFEECRKEAEFILQQLQPSQVTDKSVRAALLMARGMKTPMMVAGERTKMKTKQKVEAAAAAGAEGGGGGSSAQTPKNAPITPMIASHAKSWGVDPQELANEMAAERKAKKDG